MRVFQNRRKRRREGIDERMRSIDVELLELDSLAELAASPLWRPVGEWLLAKQRDLHRLSYGERDPIGIAKITGVALGIETVLERVNEHGGRREALRAERETLGRELGELDAKE